MDCSTYSSRLHYADCKLINNHVPEASILIVVIAVVVAIWKLNDRHPVTEKIKTEAPWKWRLAAWTILLPGIYFDITIIRFTANWTTKAMEEATPKDDPAWPFFLFVLCLLAFVAMIVFFLALFGLWIGFLYEIGNTHAQALKAKDEERGIPLPEMSGGGVDGDAAAHSNVSNTALEASAAAFSEEAAEWALPHNEGQSEDGSKGATLINPPSSESQSAEDEEHSNLASQTSRTGDDHAAALQDKPSNPRATVVAETSEYALSSEEDEEDDGSDSYCYATASPGEPSIGQDPWAAEIYGAADLAFASDEKKEESDGSEAKKHAATPQHELSTQEESSATVMFEATEYHVPCVEEDEADDSSDATLLTPSSSEREWAAENSDLRSMGKEDETAKANSDESNPRSSDEDRKDQIRRYLGHPIPDPTSQSRRNRQGDRGCAQQ